MYQLETKDFTMNSVKPKQKRMTANIPNTSYYKILRIIVSYIWKGLRTLSSDSIYFTESFTK